MDWSHYVTYWLIALSFVIFQSCGVKVDHTGRVEADVHLGIDLDMLRELCEYRLGLHNTDPKTWSVYDKELLDECVAEEYEKLTEIFNSEIFIN